MLAVLVTYAPYTFPLLLTRCIAPGTKGGIAPGTKGASLSSITALPATSLRNDSRVQQWQQIPFLLQNKAVNTTG